MRTTVPIMVCGRVKRTKARQNCRTASSGVVSRLRRERCAARSLFRRTPQLQAAHARSRTRWRQAAKKTRPRWQRRLWTRSRAAPGCPRWQRSVSCSGRDPRSGEAAHAAPDACGLPFHLARRRRRGEEAGRAQKLRARRDGNCCVAAGWSTQEPEQAVSTCSGAASQARTVAARRARRRCDDKPRMRLGLCAGALPAVRSGAQRAGCRRHRRRSVALHRRRSGGGLGFDRGPNKRASEARRGAPGPWRSSPHSPSAASLPVLPTRV